jgi:site-specific recombinase XerD
MRWLNRFDEHLERVAGAAASTRRQYELIAARFLHQRFGETEPEWSQICADDLSSFAQSEATRRKGFGRKVPGVALRAFLRFLVAYGCIRDGLGAAIPSPRQYQHATLPDRATTEQVNAVMTCCQDGTAVGLRDYAVLLLLVRLGLRALEAVRLTLDDIDWRGGVLLVRAGKTRRERRLPLTEEVGTALAAYIRSGRPSTSTRAIFLHAQPPHQPWHGASAVSQLVHRRLLQSGYPAQPWRGAHLFRHTVASQMVNAGVSFKDVADVLGHQSLATTGLYAKLNLDNLNRVALPWPGGK